MRALAALRGWSGRRRFGWRWSDVGDRQYVVCEEAAGGRAALAVSRVVSGAGEARLAREEVCINMNKCSVY